MQILRPYNPNDKPQVLALLALNTPTYFAESEAADLDHYLDREIELYFVIEIDAQIRACGGINYDKTSQKGILSWDIVHPDFQGKSLGSQLVRHRVDLLRNDSEIRHIQVRTSQHVYLFYAKMGFRVQQVIPNYWADGFDLYDMSFGD
jgi:[ribosomal protein S18]-alanine N-acetyltransferase